MTESGGSIVTTHPVQGDTAILDASSGSVTVDVASTATDITATGYTHTLTLSAGLTVYGNLLFVAGMTFTPGTQTVTFAATDAGHTVTSGGKSFYNVTWNGSGDWTLQDAFTQTHTTAFTLGTLNLNGKTYTNDYIQTVTLGSGFTFNIGTGSFLSINGTSLTIPTGAITSISTGTLKVKHFIVSGTGTFTATGAATILLYGNVNISSSNFSAGTSTLTQRYYAQTLSSNQPLYNYTVGDGASGVSVTLNSDLTVLNNFTIIYSVNGRSFNAGIYTINVGGNWANGDTFTAGGSTVVFNDATKVSTISGTTTFNILQSLTPDKTVKFTAGTTTTVGSFDFTGTAGHLITLDTDTGASTFTLTDTAGVNQVEYCDIHRSTAGGGATWDASTLNGNVDGGSNSGWSF